MAKGHQTHEMPTASQSGNGAASAHESLDEIVARFAQAKPDATTVREAFAYADQSFCFGNGQFTAVPWHLPGGLSVECRRAVAIIAAGGRGNAADDDEIGRSVAAAEKLARDTQAASLSHPTLLEEAVDDYFYQYGRMPKAEKDAAGYTFPMQEVGADGKVKHLTSFDDRRLLVGIILGKDLSATVPEGLPQSGFPWFDVVGQAIVDFVSRLRLDGDGNVKRKAKLEKKAGATAAAPGQPSKSASALL